MEREKRGHERRLKFAKKQREKEKRKRWAAGERENLDLLGPHALGKEGEDRGRERNI